MINRPADSILPHDAAEATLVGRVFDPGTGPCVVRVDQDRLTDITRSFPTTSDAADRPDPARAVREAPADRSWSLSEVITDTFAEQTDRVRLLAPIDLQVIKAAGVTFARSLIERVIEERAGGDPDRAATIRSQITDVVGGSIEVEPGSAAAERAKQVLQAEGLWSQYLEVGIGPDPEIFTKAPVLSAVGTGARIGVLARSVWNNPEPELVLISDSTGRPVGATLGNDVNLRDFEGRSALLLGEAKDNNASCALGPFVRLFDHGFALEDAARIEIELTVTGSDDYTLRGVSPVSEISRPLPRLIEAAFGDHHRYPDGFVLFTGTMFAPTDDRDRPGQGFTHKIDDEVRISSPALGSLINTVDTAEDAPDWTHGIGYLMRNLAGRGLLDRTR